MKVVKVEMTLDEKRQRIEKSRRVFYGTRLEFLRAHRGFRPQCFHLVLGMPGGGKSTLRNSVISDFASANPDKRIFLWLSEESVEDFMSDLAFNSDIVNAMKNLYVYSEQDNPLSPNQSQAIEEFNEILIKSECDLFVYDNITTSKLYGSTFGEQENFASSLKANLQKLSGTNMIFAHTSSSIKQTHDSLIDMNDIRGSKSLVNLAEFLYVLQSFNVKEKTFTTIRIQKHRNQPCDKKMFVLNYDSKRKIYDQDGSVDFELFNEIFSKRNKLGAKKSSKRN